MPLVVAFHGVGDSPESMAEYSALDDLAAEQGFALVYPAAKSAMWDVRPEGNADVLFFDELLQALPDRAPIDLSRVYVVGMSNGASFAQLLRGARNRDIAAIVAHSGSSPIPITADGYETPVMLLAGKRDGFIVEAMRDDYAEYQRAEQSAEFLVISGLGHAWSRNHNEAMWDFLAEYSNSGRIDSVPDISAGKNVPGERNQQRR